MYLGQRLEYGLEVSELSAFVKWISSSLASNFPFVLPQMTHASMVLKSSSDRDLVANKKPRHFEESVLTQMKGGQEEDINLDRESITSRRKFDGC